jgi:serine/threonine protein phosphatase PrpC
MCSAHYSAKGRRTFLEDAVVCEERLFVPGAHVIGAAAYCIFDGHGGDTCAKFAAQRYKGVLLQQLAKRALATGLQLTARPSGCSTRRTWLKVLAMAPLVLQLSAWALMASTRECALISFRMRSTTSSCIFLA